MTTDERLENLERELARAKRRNRWLLAAVGLCVLGVGGCVLAQTAAWAGMTTVRAKRFVLVDDARKTRAVLDMNAGGLTMLEQAIGGPGLTLYDEAGNTSAMLTVGAGGPALYLYDAGTPRVMVKADANRSGLTLFDAAGKTRAGLNVIGRADGSAVAGFVDGPALYLYDAAGKGGVGLNVTPNGPGLYLANATGLARVGLNVTPNGPALSLYDDKGRLRATAGAIQTETLEGKVITYPESSLFLWDVNGKPLWKAP